MSNANANAEIITRLTDEACAALARLTTRDAILVVFNRARDAWSLLIGAPASTSADLTDYDEVVQLNVDATMDRRAVQTQVEKCTQHLARVLATEKP